MATVKSESKTVGGRGERFSVPRNLVVALLGLLGLFILLNYTGFRLLMARWDSDSNYGHGYLIPFISFYFIWAKKDELRLLEPVPCLWGLAIFLFGLVMGYLVMPLASAVLSGIVIVVMVNGLVLYLGGTKVYRLLLLPAVYLIFMVPLPTPVHSAVANPLQHFASWASAGILDGILGVTTIRTGNIIKLAGHTLQVAEACSGMRSIMGLLALGVAFAYFWERPLWERTFLIISTIPIAIIANICRVTGTGLTYHLGYEQLAQGFYHEFTGWFVFVFAMALFLTEAWVMSHLFVYEQHPVVSGEAVADGEGAGTAGEADG